MPPIRCASGATGRSPLRGGRADVERLADDGHESLQLDLSETRSIHAAIDEILARTSGRLYGLFNNGGFGQTGAVEDVPVEALRAQFETNVFGWHTAIRRVLPVMRAAREGRIVQNSSVLGLVALPYRGAYVASKFAIEALTDAMRLELRNSGVHVALIEPGPIESRFRANAYVAFKRNIDVGSSPHRDVYQAVIRRFEDDDEEAPFTLPESRWSRSSCMRWRAPGRRRATTLRFPPTRWGSSSGCFRPGGSTRYWPGYPARNFAGPRTHRNDRRHFAP